MPLTDEALAKDGLIQFPTVIGGVVPVVNIAGVAPGKLRLTGQVLGDIYLGKITKWNDAAVTALNPGVALPMRAISPVRRADGSGTTFIFTNYLSKVNPDWKAKVGRAPQSTGRPARRQGQRRRLGLRAAPAELDRLCRVRVCQAEQDGLHAAEEQGRQFRSARRRQLQAAPPVRSGARPFSRSSPTCPARRAGRLAARPSS
jgi:hypothetical protein